MWFGRREQPLYGLRASTFFNDAHAHGSRLTDQAKKAVDGLFKSCGDALDQVQRLNLFIGTNRLVPLIAGPGSTLDIPAVAKPVLLGTYGVAAPGGLATGLIGVPLEACQVWGDDCRAWLTPEGELVVGGQLLSCYAVGIGAPPQLDTLLDDFWSALEG